MQERRHLEQKDLSDCCGESIIEDSDICSKCGEHCEREKIINEEIEVQADSLRKDEDGITKFEE